VGPARTTPPSSPGFRSAPVVRTDVGNRGGIGVWAFALCIVTAGALAHVAVRLRGIQIAYDLGRERRTNVELEERRRRLNIEIGMLKDPGRVIGIAHDKLHMGPPEASEVIHLGQGAVLP
jgi:cell division protein FtsL